MADDANPSCAPAGRPTNRSPPAVSPARMGIPLLLAFASFALAGCNANQGVNVSSPTTSGVAAGPYFPRYDRYNPISYAQTSGFYGGR